MKWSKIHGMSQDNILVWYQMGRKTKYDPRQKMRIFVATLHIGTNPYNHVDCQRPMDGF